MAFERSARGNEASAADAEIHAAPEAAPATRFHAEGPLPPVAEEGAGGDRAAPERRSASDMAFGDQPKFIAGDIMYEQLAHRFAYRDSLTNEDHEWLRAQGLQARAPVHGRHGFAMMVFTPLAGFEDRRRPVVAFRGTNDFKDAVDDFNSAGVGASQMAANEGLIGSTLVGLQGFGLAPAVCGHSLGGALAQMAASRFPDLVAKVVTFQSPGIPKKMTERVNGDDINSHHYQVNGDIVGMSGESFTPGRVSQIDRPSGYLFRHTGYVTSYADEHPESSKQVDARQSGGRVEGLRAGFGRFLGALQQLTNRGDGEYLDVWEKVRDAVDREAAPPEIRELIQQSELSAKDKTYMLGQLEQVIAANAFEDRREPEPASAAAI